MAQKPIRETEQIRRDCARKLQSIRNSGLLSALLASLLNEDWTTPRIEELRITRDRHLVGRIPGEVTFKAFRGAKAGLIRNIHGVAAVADLDADELGYLLGKVAGIKSMT